MKLDNKFIMTYKKNSIAILLSISMTIALIFSVLAVKDTDDHMEELRYEYMRGAQDFFLPGLNQDQVRQLQENKKIKHLGLSCFKECVKSNEEQAATINASNDKSILSNSKLIKGRLPKSANELVAEDWVLRNMNIRPVLGSVVTLKKCLDPKKWTKFVNQQYTIVGVITDNPLNKSSARLFMHCGYTKDSLTDGKIEAAIKLNKGFNTKKELKSMIDTLHIKKTKGLMNQYRAVSDEEKELDQTRLALILALLLISTIIIMGIYRISILSRTSQYGILRAIGMKKRKVFKLMLSELFKLYIVSVPIGFALGFLFTYLMSISTKDKTAQIILWGKEIPVEYVIPFTRIIEFTLGVGILIIFIAIYSFRYATKESIVKSISNKGASKSTKFHFISIQSKHGFLSSYKKVGLKYMFRDKMETLFIVLSIAISCSLLIGLYQKASWDSECNRYNERLLGMTVDYKMEKAWDGSCKTGLANSIVDKIRKEKGVKSVAARMTIPVRVVDDGTVGRNKAYCDAMEEAFGGKKSWFSGYKGNDGVDNYYKTNLSGYNEDALRKVHEYLLDGDFDPAHMKKDEIIMFMPKSAEKNGDFPAVGFTENGYNAFDYKVGDTITVKYRTDLNTTSMKFYKGQDKGAAYTTHKFKIAAMVYYSYIKETGGLIESYPGIIMNEKQYYDLFHQNVYSCINVEPKDSISTETLNNIQAKMQVLALKNKSATVQNIRDERIDMDHMIKKQNVYCIGIVLVVLLLAFMNIINNLKYRINTRKQEVSIYRAIGMNSKTVSRMLRFENVMIGIFSLVLTVVLSYGITKYLYGKTNAEYFGMEYQYNYILFVVMSIVTLCIVCIISKVFAKKLCDENIIEGITDIE